jgi:hypothetical protein
VTALIAEKFRDRLAIFLSALCVVQCLFLPVVVTFLPFLDIWWLSDHFLHPFLLLIVVPLTLYTLLPARAKHLSNAPLKLAIPGLMLLFAGVFMEQTVMEKILTVIGASFLAAAHIKNILLSRYNCKVIEPEQALEKV